MTLYETWLKRAFTEDGKSNEETWQSYLPREQKIYEYLIGEKLTTLSGTVSDLANRFSLTTDEVVAFVDGINDVLPVQYDLETIEENTQIEISYAFDKLFQKMVEYKADHLAALPEWDAIFNAEEKKRLTLEQKKSRTVVKGEKVGRNDPCPCGSGKKYKKCCGLSA